ncbi:MAG: TIGR02466 family protein [Pseudomonadota bacterium]|nr:TIGR02466 family protein [Pseudomonadota bacterium]
MSKIQSFFPTLIYRADSATTAGLNAKLEQASLMLAQDDLVGIKWCEKHGYQGYTSFASINDLPAHIPAFKALEKILDRHAANFAKALHWDIRGGKPVCDSMWVNVLPEGGSHTSHIHTNSVISGTYYVCVPHGAGPIVYEDPRHAMMMAAPPKKQNAPREHQSQISETPEAGSLLLWESWLRHEVPVNRADGMRISISFNYVIGEK